ncbi:4698_t:CDS:2, partial [Diversispora eburnea]
MKSKYPINYQFHDKELNPQSDQNTLSYLYHSDMLQIKPVELIKSSNNKVWKLFKKSLHSNKCEAERCIKILLIITEGFSISRLKKNLVVSSDTITNAHKHAHLYEPGAPQFEKSKRIVNKMAEIKEQQFLWFFQDRANISQSSYKIDSKSNLLICYLHDQKSELWKKFEETYPNGMKKTSFMTCLTNATHLKYRDDLGALCQICNDYEFESFENLESIVQEDISEKKNWDIILTYIDQLKRHMRRGYEEELEINSDGTLAHNSYISHCLLYAFGNCNQ